MLSKITALFSSKSAKPLSKHRYIVVPDIHGTYSIYKKVEKYIKKNLQNDQKIIFLGDYVNRGESGEIDGRKFKDIGSFLVLRDLLKFKTWADSRGIEVVFLRGNHELMLQEYYLEGGKGSYDEYDFVRNSVECLDYVFEKDRDFYEAFKEFLLNLKPYYMDELKRYLFVHAGLDPKIKSLQKQVENGAIYWIRDEFVFAKKRFKNIVVFGHTPFSSPFVKSDRIGLDSGVYKRSFMNLLEIDYENSKIVQIFK